MENGQEQWLLLNDEDQITRWGKEILLEGFKLQRQLDGRLVNVSTRAENFDEVVNEDGMKSFKLKSFGYQFLEN